MKGIVSFLLLVVMVVSSCELAEVAASSNDAPIVTEQDVDPKQPPPHQMEVLPCDSRQPSSGRM